MPSYNAHNRRVLPYDAFGGVLSFPETWGLKSPDVRLFFREIPVDSNPEMLTVKLLLKFYCHTV